MTIHAGLANAFHSPKVMISEDEAKKLADAAQRVARHYEMPHVAQQTKDWIGLITACGAIYGPRVSAHLLEKKMANEARNAPRPPVADTTDQPVFFNQPLPEGS